MLKQDFLKEHNKHSDSIIEEFGNFIYFMSTEVISLSVIEKEIESIGYTTKRITDTGVLTLYTEVYFENKLIGILSISGTFPEINVLKRNRKHARAIAQLLSAIEPVKGVHRILDWHDIKEEKLHCLANGSTIVHFKKPEISVDSVRGLLHFNGFDHEAIAYFKNLDNNKKDV